MKEETPEEVHMLLRKDLQPQNYVTPQQIKSIFSQWTREKASAPVKPGSVSDDIMEGMTSFEIILFLIYS